jgi:hypothetical protein
MILTIIFCIIENDAQLLKIHYQLCNFIVHFLMKSNIIRRWRRINKKRAHNLFKNKESVRQGEEVSVPNLNIDLNGSFPKQELCPSTHLLPGIDENMPPPEDFRYDSLLASGNIPSLEIIFSIESGEKALEVRCSWDSLNQISSLYFDSSFDSRNENSFQESKDDQKDYSGKNLECDSREEAIDFIWEKENKDHFLGFLKLKYEISTKIRFNNG